MKKNLLKCFSIALLLLATIAVFSANNVSVVYDSTSKNILQTDLNYRLASLTNAGITINASGAWIRLGVSNALSAGIYDGDSRTVGQGGTAPYAPYPSNLSLVEPFQIINTAVSGRTLQQMLVAATNTFANLNWNGRRNIVTVWGGINDFYFGRSVSDTVDSLIAYCQAVRRAGLKVIVSTEINHSGQVGDGIGMPAGPFYPVVLTFNNTIRAHWPEFADGLQDLGANTNLLSQFSYTNTLYYNADGIHLTNGGYQIVSQINSNAVNNYTGGNDARSTFTSEGIQVLGQTANPIGAGGIEIDWDASGSMGYITGYSRSNSVWKSITLRSDLLYLNYQNTTKGTVGSQGFRFDSIYNSNSLSQIGLAEFYGSTFFHGGVQIDGAIATPSGSGGIEIEYNGGINLLTAYNRASSTWLPLNLRGGTISLLSSGTTVATITTAGINMLSGSFNFNGSGLTNLNASELRSGTVPIARAPATGTGITNTGSLYSLNVVAGSNVTLATNANGQVSIASSGGGGGGGGNVTNTGTSVVSNVPRYTDTTGTQIAPSTMTVDASGNAVILGSLLTGQAITDYSLVPNMVLQASSGQILESSVVTSAQLLLLTNNTTGSGAIVRSNAPVLLQPIFDVAVITSGAISGYVGATGAIPGTNAGVGVIGSGYDVGLLTGSGAGHGVVVRNAGTNLTSVTDGLQVGAGFSVGGGAWVQSVLSATATLDFGSILAASSADLTITVTGAAANDAVQMGLPTAPNSSIVYNMFVSGGNTVTVRAYNVGAITVDPASATYRATVFHY